MNNVREVNRINEKELELAVEGGASWHDDYNDSAYIFVGGLDKRLTEGDVISIFSQYGEILDINLPRIPEGGLRDRNADNIPSSGARNDRDKEQQQQQSGGKPGDRRGFGFLLYEDQRSTILAVDNLNGFNLLGRTIRVDHVKDYKMPGAKRREEEGEKLEPSRNAAPAIEDGSASEIGSDEALDVDLADPMAAYIAASKKDKVKSKEEKEERRRRKQERRIRREEKAMKKRSHETDSRRSSEVKRRRDEDDADNRHSHRRYHDDEDRRRSSRVDYDYDRRDRRDVERRSRDYSDNRYQERERNTYQESYRRR